MDARWIRRLPLGLVTVFALLNSLLAPASADRAGPTGNDQIARLYIGVLGRQPDLSGEVYWNFLEGEGHGLRSIARFFVTSPEFSQRFGIGHSAIVTALYRNVLGRSPDDGGYDYWLGLLADGVPVGDVVVGFTESPENIALSRGYASRYDAAVGSACVPVIDSYLLDYAEYLRDDGRSVSIAVNDLRNGCSYGLDRSQQMPGASTVKMLLLGATMLNAQDTGRSLTSSEKNKLDGMIRYSDDADVGPMFEALGGTARVLMAYGPRLGVTNSADNSRWGCIMWDADSASALARHLIVNGVGALSAEHQAYARELMGSVARTQRWGVGDGTTSADPTAFVAQKNGFAPPCQGTGSKLNSVGVVYLEGIPAYSVALLSHGWSNGPLASRSDDQPVYVEEGAEHLSNISEHIARMLSG